MTKETFRGRPKSNRFEASHEDYYLAKRKWFALYVGNEISGIHDQSIDSRLKLEASIRGFLHYDAKWLFMEFKLFGNLINDASEFRKSFVESDPIDNNIFVIVSNVRKVENFNIYSIFYVPWRDSEIKSLIESTIQKKNDDETNHLAARGCEWFVNFFKKYAKNVPANEEEILKIKEIMENVRKK